MTVETGDIEQQLKPGWIPEGWERGDPIIVNKGWAQFQFYRFMCIPFTAENAGLPVNEVCYRFPNHRFREFEEWLAWWNYE